MTTKRGKYNVKTRQQLNEQYLANNDFDNLVINNTPFIIGIAKSFNQPQYYTDLIQEGKIGLYKAFNTYVPGTPFLGYAKVIITNQMATFLRQYSNTVTTPRNIIGEERIPTISLDTPNEDDTASLSDLIPSDDSQPQNEFKVLKIALKLIKKEKHQKMMMMWLGVNEDGEEVDKMSFQAIADTFGTSRQNIEEQIKKVLKQLSENEQFRRIYQA